jgi:hypothetical protein
VLIVSVGGFLGITYPTLDTTKDALKSARRNLRLSDCCLRREPPRRHIARKLAQHSLQMAP